MPAFMYICGMVSFSRSFRVTRILGFLVPLEAVLALSVVVLLESVRGAVVADAESVVVGGRAPVVADDVWRTLVGASVPLGERCVLNSSGVSVDNTKKKK